MSTEELQEIIQDLKAVQAKIRSSENWDLDWFSGHLVWKIWNEIKDIDYYIEESEIAKLDLKDQDKAYKKLHTSYFSDKQSNSVYDPWLPADEYNQPTY